MRVFPLLSIGLVGLCLFLVSCGSQSEITVKGAEPITSDEINLWTERALASYNYDNIFLTQTLPPLDPPNFQKCQAFIRGEATPGSITPGNSPLSQCRERYRILRNSVINTLIVSRWAMSRDNPLRVDKKSKAALYTTRLELASTFPDPRSQKQFLNQTRLTRSVLAQRRVMDFAAADYLRQSAGNVDQPSLKDLDAVINSDSRLQRLPIAKARAEASRIWIDKQRQDRGGNYDTSAIRRATRCGEGINSALCGNRPAPGVADVTAIIMAGPLVPRGGGEFGTQEEEELIARAEGFRGRTPPRNLGDSSPLPYSSYDPSLEVEIERRDNSQR